MPEPDVRPLTYAQDLLMRQTYMRRLAQWLALQVTRKILTQSDANRYKASAQATVMQRERPGSDAFRFEVGMLNEQGLLPYSDVLFVPEIEWAESLSKETSQAQAVQKTGATQAAALNRYMARFMPLANRLRRDGVPEEQIQGMIGQIQQSVQTGVTSEKDLPYFTDVERYWKQIEEQAKFFEEEPERQREAAEEFAGEFQRGTAQQVHLRRMRAQQRKQALATTAERRAQEGRPSWQGDEQRQGMVEQLRSQLLSQLTGSEDWINRWITQNWERQAPWRKEYESLMGDIQGSPFPGVASQEQLAGLRGVGMMKQQWEAEQPSALPPAPEWLTQFAPGLEAGQPITRQTLAPPSGQQWAALSPQRRGMLSGYASWGGQSLEDILGQTQQMLPRTPAGAGRTWWRPQRQRTMR